MVLFFIVIASIWCLVVGIDLTVFLIRKQRRIKFLDEEKKRAIKMIENFYGLKFDKNTEWYDVIKKAQLNKIWEIAK